MERHRRDQVGLGQKLAAGAGHPAAAGTGNVGPIAVLEGQEQTTTPRVVDQRGAGEAIARRPGEASAAERATARILDEGSGAARAIGRRHEGEALPARRAQRAWRLDDFVASKAKRRQHGIEQHATGVRAGLTQSGGQHAGIRPSKCADRMATPLLAPTTSPYYRPSCFRPTYGL